MAEPYTFEVGEQTRLKSGGPSLTVMSGGDKTTTCQWFTPKGKLRHGLFPNPSLHKHLPWNKEEFGAEDQR